MTEIEKKALALLNGSGWKGAYLKRAWNPRYEALCRAIEQHEAFKQEVSDAVEEWGERWIGAGDSHSYFMSLFSRFIIPKPVDPLVDVVAEVRPWDTAQQWNNEAFSKRLREALARRGLEITKKEGV